MITILTSMLAALVSDAETVAAARAAGNELQNRLGLREEPLASIRKFNYLRATYGDDALVFAAGWLELSGLRPHSDDGWSLSPRARPMLTWLVAQCAKELAARQVGYSDSRGFEPLGRVRDVVEDVFELPVNLGHLVDWFNTVRPNLFSLSLREAFAAADAWNMDLGGLSFQATLKGQGKAVYSDPEWPDLEVLELVNKHQLEYESQKMSHCVGRDPHYLRGVQSGSFSIYSVRRAGQPVLTLQVMRDRSGKPTHIMQCKTRRDGTPMSLDTTEWSEDRDLLRFAQRWMSESFPHDAVTWAPEAFEVVAATYDNHQLSQLIEEFPQLMAAPENLHLPSFADFVHRTLDENYDRELEEAWTNAVESGDSDLIDEHVAYRQIERLDKRWLKGLNDLLHEDPRTRTHDRYHPQGEEDSVEPYWFSRDVALEGDEGRAKLVVSLRGLLFFNVRDVPPYGDWHLVFWKAARFERDGVVLTTPNYREVTGLDPIAKLIEDVRAQWLEFDFRAAREAFRRISTGGGWPTSQSEFQFLMISQFPKDVNHVLADLLVFDDHLVDADGGSVDDEEWMKYFPNEPWTLYLSEPEP